MASQPLAPTLLAAFGKLQPRVTRAAAQELDCQQPAKHHHEAHITIAAPARSPPPCARTPRITSPWPTGPLLSARGRAAGRLQSRAGVRALSHFVDCTSSATARLQLSPHP
ncbi:hypothetical protein BD626DRAFT_571412 [Schizophyllum amplum]|uniref:Uncharacterized protein n=1 Tax=Schizophyllum amplum TaxID=97359 RepID=A0A550C7C1_9AGAR|nr:hypothetical protein BD626DRAFT_571412 [Auriculariopsis ampla]